MELALTFKDASFCMALAGIVGALLLMYGILSAM